MSRAVLPTLYVGVAFGYDATDPAPVFTDVSAMVLPGWDCRAGRDHESDRVRVGTLTMTFRDPDGRFNPLNTASPYWPNVRPMVPIWVTETVGGTTYPVFRGFVERWPPAWSMHGRYGTVTVTAVDMLAALAGTDLRTPLDTVCLADRPAYLYPLDEPQESRQGADLVAPGVSPLMTVVNSKYGPGTVTWGATTTLSEAPTGVSLGGTGSLNPSPTSILAVQQAVIGPSGPFSLACWFATSAAPSSLSYLAAVTDGLFGAAVALYIDNNGRLHFQSPVYNANTAGSVCDGRWHYAVAVYDGTSVRLYLDGALADSAAVGALTAPGLMSTQLGGLVTGTRSQGQFVGSLARFAAYPTALSAARVLEHYQAGTQSFFGDTYGARANRLLDYVGWTGPRQVDAGSSQMLGATGLAGTDALTALLDNAASEGGVLYAAKGGTVVAEGRNARYLRTTAALTLGDGAGEVPYQQGIAPDYDLTYVANRVTAIRPYGVTAVATDPVSRGRYFERTRESTLRITSDQQTVDAANFALARYHEPQMRIGLVTVQLATLQAADVQKVLGLSIAARVTVAVRPVGQPGFTAAFYVESIGRRTATNSALVDLTLSPAADPHAALWDIGVWDDPHAAWAY